MLGLLIIFSFWIAITIMLIVPLILTFALGGYLAEKLELYGFSYYCFNVSNNHTIIFGDDVISRLLKNTKVIK